ncbi:unnamed protein product [Peronospora destructor]|uniref:Uncharacterized protein n=1 Tax=Peronospora destructor TaxID=86335 RepID=A0AAV0T1L5_9STRA|nr:unnamed protein product [Peronospora destructor]
MVNATTPASRIPENMGQPTLQSPAEIKGNNLNNFKLKSSQAGGSLPQLANAVPFVAYSAPLIEQQHLIAALIKRSRADEVFMPSRTNSRWNAPMHIGRAKFLAQYGLQAKHTPATPLGIATATGNCHIHGEY